MLPLLTFDLPEKSDWMYEVKYDGFRAILDWDKSGIHFTSRNGKPLNAQFPEVEHFLTENKNLFHCFIPLRLDGELVNLVNPFKADFSALQTRGHLRNKIKIKKRSHDFPCQFMAFDLLILEGISLQHRPYKVRKRKLEAFFQQIGLQLTPDHSNKQLLQFVKAHPNVHELWEKILLHDGEGIVAKQVNSLWEEGKRSSCWLKYKNWKHVSCFITAWDKTNGYFSLGVYHKQNIRMIGQVLFGLRPEEKHALQKIIQQNCIREDERYLYVNPAICLEVIYLELYENELREPTFHRFLLEMKPEECTFERFISKKKNLPAKIEISHPDKMLWENLHIKKQDYMHYLLDVSPFLLPFLKNRLLTVIRYPDGMLGEPFFQKNCPDYAPDFVPTCKDDGINYIVCNNIDTLIWLGNQLAIEFHIPFQTIDSHCPSEIVFDLDPPSIKYFHLAIKAALMIKDILDQLKLISFIKTSGNKGLQVYIPLPDGIYSYDDTRLFTSFVAEYLVTREPELFTTERLKKKRGQRLYVDYLQHSEGKTIISPYSLRGNQHAGVATPLYWDEVNDKLQAEMFTMQTAIKRLDNKINPFLDYFESKHLQPFQSVLDFFKNQK